MTAGELITVFALIFEIRYINSCTSSVVASDAEALFKSVSVITPHQAAPLHHWNQCSPGFLEHDVSHPALKH